MILNEEILISNERNHLLIQYFLNQKIIFNNRSFTI
jgi:hypothetical protein